MGSKLRLRFSKTGKARYISHLDLMATMRRALLRAGIELKYSEGFNPHPYMSVALPLPVGCGSVCELLDFEPAEGVLPAGLPEAVSAALPEGIEVLEAYSPDRKFSGIVWLDVCGKLFYDEGAPTGEAEKLAGRFASGSIVISKKTKRGISEIDIAPFISDVIFDGDTDRGTITMKAKVTAQNPTITTANLMSALTGQPGHAKPGFTEFIRKEVYDANMDVFR